MSDDAQNFSNGAPRRRAYLLRIGALSLVSLILLLLVLAVWVASYARNDLSFDREGFVVFANEGEVVLRATSADPLWGNTQSIDGCMILGLGAYKMTFPNGILYSFAFPLWFIAILLAIAPAVRFRRIALDERVRRRRAEGRCVDCGYDLRSSPGNCPECGRPAEIGIGTSAAV